MHTLAIAALALVASTACATPGEWSNATDKTTEIAVAPSPVKPVVLELGKGKKPLRSLPFTATPDGLAFRVPPGATVQLWARGELVGEAEPLFSTAARYGAFPRIAVGPLVVDRITDPAHPTENPAWEIAPGRFRAYPEGALPVSVKVRNDGGAAWKNPRVRLFAPDMWQIAPPFSPLVTGQGKPIKSLAAGASAIAAFTVRIPRHAALASPSPLVAFLRFEMAGKSVTVQNNVSVTLQEPIERRYSMTEKGDRFIVRLISHFQPAVLGTATVEVRKPAGADWSVTSPDATLVKGTADAAALVSGLTLPTDQIGVPVVVTLNGYRMGYTPVAAVVAAFTTSPTVERGLTRLPAGSSPMSLSPDGLCFADTAGSDHYLALNVAPRFAVSDPTEFVSPSWVTVGLVNKGATRIRLDYDAFGSDKPTVVGDLPITRANGAQTFSFLLPDARFTGKLPEGADIRLVLSGGSACIQHITVTKWNPLKQ